MPCPFCALCGEWSGRVRQSFEASPLANLGPLPAFAWLHLDVGASGEWALAFASALCVQRPLGNPGGLSLLAPAVSVCLGVCLSVCLSVCGPVGVCGGRVDPYRACLLARLPAWGSLCFGLSSLEVCACGVWCPAFACALGAQRPLGNPGGLALPALAVSLCVCLSLCLSASGSVWWWWWGGPCSRMLACLLACLARSALACLHLDVGASGV